MPLCAAGFFFFHGYDYQLENFIIFLNEMKRYICGISYKTLSTTLKELESDKLVLRKEYPQIPPKVEYSLTQRGKSLMPILDVNGASVIGCKTFTHV